MIDYEHARARSFLENNFKLSIQYSPKRSLKTALRHLYVPAYWLRFIVHSIGKLINDLMQRCSALSCGPLFSFPFVLPISFHLPLMVLSAGNQAMDKLHSFDWRSKTTIRIFFTTKILFKTISSWRLHKKEITSLIETYYQWKKLTKFNIPGLLD